MAENQKMRWFQRSAQFSSEWAQDVLFWLVQDVLGCFRKICRFSEKVAEETQAHNYQLVMTRMCRCGRRPEKK
jgi:hypothetical protein